MNEIRFLFLGTPRVECNGQDVGLQRRKALALLAYLALHDQPQSRETLATLLWPELSGSRARGNLRRELSLLRTHLGDGVFGGDRLRLGLRPEAPIWIDVRRFRELIERVQAEERRLGSIEPASMQTLEEAVSLYEDDFLAGFSLPDSPEFDDWQFREADQLRQSLAWALQHLISWHKQQSEFKDAAEYARRWVSLDRYHEPAQREFIRSLAMDDRWSAALHQYEQLVSLLDDELGVEPEEETQRLAAQIASRRLDEAKPSAPRISSHVTPRPDQQARRLPMPTALFLGREKELKDLDGLLTNPDVRLVTVLGPGGMGKTNLTIAYGRRLLEREEPHPLFSDGVHFVVLGEQDTPERIPFAVAQGIGLRLGAAGDGELAAEQQVIDFLRSRRMLLILDNAEVASGCADLVAGVLQDAPGVRIVVTSRRRLLLVEEHLLVIEGMALPESQPDATELSPEELLAYPAIELFVQCARRHKPDFELSSENGGKVLEICRQVGGMPLAIELAASRVSVLPLDAIAAEISHNLDILESTMHNRPQRQRSMRAVISATWEGLYADDRTVFARLAAFHGGWTRDAAQYVADASLASLSRLIDQSLVTYQAGVDRYDMHEMLRQFAVEKLNEDEHQLERTTRSHAVFYLEQFAARAPDLFGFRQRQTMNELRPDSANLSTAWNWAVEHRTWRLIAPALDGYAQFLELDGRYREGHELFQRVDDQLATIDTASDPDQAMLLARTLVWKGVFAQWLGRSDITTSSVAEASQLLEAPPLVERDTRAIRALVLQHSGVGRFTMLEKESIDAYHEALGIFRELGDRWNEARAMAMLGRAAWSRGDFELANRYYREALALQREIGDEREIVSLLVLMSSAARYQGNFQEALRLSEEIIDRSQRTGDQVGIGLGFSSLGTTYYFLGEFDRAPSMLLEAYEILERSGALVDRIAAEMRLGFATAAAGRDDEARRWYESSRDHYLSGSMVATAAYIDANLAEIDLANDLVELALSRLEPAAATLRAVERPAALCFVLSMLAIARCRQDEVDKAIPLSCEALTTALEQVSHLPLVRALLAVPVIMDHLGRVRERDEALLTLCQEPWLARDRTVQRVLRLPFPPETHAPLEPASVRLERLEHEARRQLDVLTTKGQPNAEGSVTQPQ